MRVLVALDGGPSGEHAAAAIAAWALNSGQEIHLMSVLHPDEVHETVKGRANYAMTPRGTLSGQTLNVSDPPPVQAENRTQALARVHGEREDYLRDIARRWFTGTQPAVHVADGKSTPEAIIKVAKEIGAEVIAMGARARSSWGQALFGSVHEEVVRHAPVPVIVVGPETPVPAAAATN